MIKKKFFTLCLFFVLLLSNVKVYASIWTYSANSGSSDSGTQPINAEVGTPEVCWLYGGVSVVGDAATWDSRLSGSYKGQCGNAWASFGKNGGDDNKMAVSLFVNTSEYHFQKTSTIFESISWAKTRTGN